MGFVVGIPAVNKTGFISGVSSSSGSISGSASITGVVVGSSNSVGLVTGVAPTPPGPNPDMVPVRGGYVWSFSGDSSEYVENLPDVFGSISGQVSSNGFLSGVRGFAGVVSGVSHCGGLNRGWGKTIEADDLEVLELLGIL